MHLKNFSLLRPGEGGIKFSPAYDLLPTVLLLPEDTEETALTLHGKKKKLGPGDFRAFGAALKLTERQVANSIKRIEKGMDAAMALIGRGFGSADMANRYRKLMSDRWGRLENLKVAEGKTGPAPLP